MSRLVSSSESWGGPGRASQFDATPGRYTHGEPLVAPDLAPLPSMPQAVLIGGMGMPQAVLIGGMGMRWALMFSDRMVVIDAAGTRTITGGHWLAALEDDGAIRYGNRRWPADGSEPQRLKPLGPFAEGGRQLAGQWRDNLWTGAMQLEPSHGRLRVLVWVRSNLERYDDEGAPRWSFERPGYGSVAIAGERVIVSGEDGWVHVLGPPSDPTLRDPHVFAELSLTGTPYSVSAIDDGFIVLSAIEATPASPAAARARREGVGPRVFADRWQTEVVALDLQGAQRWRTVVDVSVVQPAIALARDRIALAGRGLACVEGGHVRWSRVFADEVYASAFGDGTLAVGFGSTIAIVDGNGELTGRVELPERVVTVPAIGPGGGLCCGTTGRTYVIPVADA